MSEDRSNNNITDYLIDISEDWLNEKFPQVFEKLLLGHITHLILYGQQTPIPKEEKAKASLMRSP